jgi:3-oxoacyl-[acyl-carrier protein] reductase
MTKDDVTKSGNKYLKQISIGRFGNPEEIAAVVAFLVSDGASYITGETTNVNGGWFMY